MNNAKNCIRLLIPVYNDWDSVSTLINQLDDAFSGNSSEINVLLVDDGSTIQLKHQLSSLKLRNINRIEILELRRNLGHQRAIAVGLAYIEDKNPCQAAIIMDGDGEDRPSDVTELLKKFNEESGKKIIFAERTRRVESLIFKIFYRLYILSHRILTGYWVRIGNFSVIPFHYISSLAVVSELWNHYAAAVVKTQIPFVTVATQRGHRFAGRSKMNFISLVLHGLSAISVYGDIVGVRLLVATSILIVLNLIAIVITIFIRVATDLAIPGWATYTIGLLIAILLQAVIISLMFIFVVLSGRQTSSFLPIRDYVYFVRTVKEIPLKR